MSHVHEATHVTSTDNTTWEVCWCGATRSRDRRGTLGWSGWHACKLCILPWMVKEVLGEVREGGPRSL